MLFTKLLTEATAFAKAIGKRDKAVVDKLRHARTAFESVAENIAECGWTHGPEDNEELRNRQRQIAADLGRVLGNLDSAIEALSKGIGPSDIKGSN